MASPSHILQDTVEPRPARTLADAHSALYQAAAAIDIPVLLELLRSYAAPKPGEDVLGALVQACADRVLLTSAADPDAHLCNVLHAVRLESVCNFEPYLVPSTCPSVAAVTCASQGWYTSLAALHQLDPWAMHQMQLLPACIHAGDDAAANAAALTASIAAGDAGETEAAVRDLWDTMMRCQQRPCHGAARVEMHAIIRVHQAAGTLETLVNFARREMQREFLNAAVQTYDVDAIQAILSVGGVPLRDSDCLFVLVLQVLHSRWLAFDSSGAIADDARCAVMFMQLFAVIPDVPARQRDVMFPMLKRFATHGNVECLRTVLGLVDVDSDASALLHAACEAVSPACIALLLERGASPTARSETGETPLDMLLASSRVSFHASAAGMVSALSLLMSGMEDARQLIRDSVVCDGAQKPPSVTALAPFRAQIAPGRTLLHLAAAVRSRPAAPLVIQTVARGHFSFCAPYVCLFRSEALDMHSVDGVYIADQFRAGGHAAAAVRVAVHVDAVVDLQPYTTRSGDAAVDSVRLLQRCKSHVQSAINMGKSRTLSAWAYMRRRQAVVRRKHAL